MRLGGRARPIAPSALLTRSRDSATALSGRPTTVKAGNPALIWTWTSTSLTSMPENATVRSRATPREGGLSVFIAMVESRQRRHSAATAVILSWHGGSVKHESIYG